MDNVKDQIRISCIEFGSDDKFEGVDKEYGVRRSNEADYEKNLEDPFQSLSERYSPAGANYDDIIISRSQLISPVSESNLFLPDVKCDECDKKTVSSSDVEISQLRKMEDEQELLVSSLIALASHFAQVQFRLRQIVQVPSHERDKLLKDLEKFAFRGVSHTENLVPSSLENLSSEFNQREIFLQRKIIDNFNAQLLKLEFLASDCDGLPNEAIEQQKIVKEFKNELNMENIDEVHDFMKFSPVDLTNCVDNAIEEIMEPLKRKEQLVSQLKTQIMDLERFIAYIQSDSNESELNEKSCEAYNSYSAKKKRIAAIDVDSHPVVSEIGDTVTVNENDFQDLREGNNFNNRTFRLVNKASFLMQMFASIHLPGNTNSFEKNILKKTPKGNNWGDLRAQLEVDVQEIISLATVLRLDEVSDQKNRLQETDTNYSILNFTSSDWIYGNPCNDHRTESAELIREELNVIIRRKFSVTLQRLIQHGLWIETESATSLLMAPFLRCLHLTWPPTQHGMVRNTPLFSSNCEPNNEDHFISGSIFGSTKNRQMHAWELILQYYYLKGGEEYNNTPARTLSQSFNLDFSDSSKITAKDSLLSAINTIIALHKPYKRSCDAHFKAFICAALNSQQLTKWFDVIFSCDQLISKYYLHNSYVARTGFRDSLRSKDSLSKYYFNLPVNFAVKHFQRKK